ncbi:metal ABC transporter permease [Pseudonocardia abyssalis]|uniref:Metal ABC transporter permease n=1 Tax=Pseudonocardia abyssalis TaxID=2792008 RepID=A0ABS6UWT8_9PSEU|nr:iron chelate uptake ABC transporter family permease subunit [Pseudonocardia abyssalis]MBW0118626.1 metal ABC transporter permease [Pseudonocardia abyssalis]MBW0136732.1 metal ABC transporter permease [Pseudonocardia abyssalis]
MFGLPYTDTVVVLGALVLGVTSGVLGTFAVLRQRSLVGDAVAHSTLPGVCVAFLVAGVKDVPGLLVGAAAAGLVAALLMVGIERTGRIKPDTAIGVVLSGFFSLGVVLLTHIASTADADQAGLENYLFGQAAGLLETDVVVMAVLGGTALLVVGVLRRALTTTLFDSSYAGSIGLPVRALEVLMTGLLVVAVVIGVRVVGAILMVAMLVVPTVVARQLADRFTWVLPIAGVVGAVVGITGSLLATRAALPTGPVIVLVGFSIAMLAVLLAPGRGVLWRASRLATRRRRVRRDAVLVSPDAPVRSLADRLARTSLRRDGLLDDDGLTAAGRRAAEELADRRALWSAWLEHGALVDLPDAREPDPTDLRGSLGDDAVAQLRLLSAGGRRG